jgi:hypothetical protein
LTGIREDISISRRFSSCGLRGLLQKQMNNTTNEIAGRLIHNVITQK